MMPRNSSRAIFAKLRSKRHRFANGMFVCYTGHQSSQVSRQHMAATPVVVGATYTVAHAVQDGPHHWLFVQELPGVRCTADGFIPVPHQAEDHWHLADA